VADNATGERKVIRSIVKRLLCVSGVDNGLSRQALAEALAEIECLKETAEIDLNDLKQADEEIACLHAQMAAIAVTTQALLAEIDRQHGLKVHARCCFDTLHPICIQAEKVSAVQPR
jgi:hypothetical protein